MRLLLGSITVVGLVILVQAVPRHNFGMDQCSQCMKDTGMGGSGTVDCYKCCCERPPPPGSKYGPWTDLKPLCSEKEQVGCAEYFVNEKDAPPEPRVHFCRELGPLGHCKRWTQMCALDGPCSYIKGGDRPVGQALPRNENGPWIGLSPRCFDSRNYQEYDGCHAYAMRGAPGNIQVHRCLSAQSEDGRKGRCTKWTKWCDLTGPCPWANAERFGEESTY